MTREEFRDMAATGAVILDGATGSNLRAAGMPVGVCTEDWVLKNPQVIQELQAGYLHAGSQILYAPTFCATRLGLEDYGLSAQAADMNRQLVALTRAVAGNACYVAGDMATCGRPVDEKDARAYARLYDNYREQAEALCAAGVDLFAVETLMGETEAIAAVEAIRSVCDLPVLVSFSTDAMGKCYFDGDLFSAAAALTALGADAVGVNCGSGPDLIEDLIARLHNECPLPVIAKPNAGLPEMQPDGSAHYAMTPQRFAMLMRRLQLAGASLLGGCCGTTPAHILALAQACYPRLFPCRRDE